MSNVTAKQKPAPVRAGILNQNSHDLQHRLDALMASVRSDILMPGVDGGTFRTPRFGDFTLLALEVPFYVIDNPYFVAATDMTTACTDGRHVFFNADFLRCLIEKEEKTGELEVLPIVLHELSHILYGHFSRLVNANDYIKNEAISAELTNIAFDIAINARILTGWDNFPWGEMISTHLGSDDPERYAEMTEEQIFLEVLKQFNKKLDANKQQQSNQQQSNQQQSNQQQGQPEQGEPGEGGAQSLDEMLDNLAKQALNSGQDNDAKGKGGDPSDDADPKAGENASGGSSGTTPEELAEMDENGLSKDEIKEAALNGKGSSSAGDFKDDVAGHLLDPETMARVISKLIHDHPELAAIRDSLGIPDEDDDDAFRAINETVKETAARVIAARKERVAQNPQISLPGAHAAEATERALQIQLEPQMDWRTALADMIDGIGGHQRKNYDDPGVSYYISPSVMGLGMPLFTPSHVQTGGEDHVVVLVDTSGSVSDEMLSDFIAEISAIMDASNGAGAKVSILNADTVVRGDPVVLTGDDVDELENFKREGYGGTSFLNGIRGAVKYIEEECPDDTISTVVYFTDLFDFPPTLEHFGEDVPPPVVYVCPEGHATGAFKEAVAEYATVVEIVEGKEVDLVEETEGVRASLGM